MIWHAARSDPPRERCCPPGAVVEHRGRRSKYRARRQPYGNTINVRYDSVDNRDCCEWHFRSPALPTITVWRVAGVRWVVTGIRSACAS